jgi:hypothetical protein
LYMYLQRLLLMKSRKSVRLICFELHEKRASSMALTSYRFNY